MTTAAFESATLDRTYEYQVYLPPGYELSGMRYPVIYLLHGRGDTMDAWWDAPNVLDSLIFELRPDFVAEGDREYANFVGEGTNEGERWMCSGEVREGKNSSAKQGL